MIHTRKRVILRRQDTGAPSGSDVAQRLDRMSDVAVLDRGDEMVLVEGTAPALEDLSQKLGSEGWRAFPLRTIDKPDVRPRVLKPPREVDGE
jgi:hypothetical protein